MTDGSAARTVWKTPMTFTSISVLKACRIDGQQRSVGGDTGVGHHDVDATESLDTCIGGPLHGGEIAYVGDRGQHPVAHRAWPATLFEPTSSRSVSTSLAPLSCRRRATSAPMPLAAAGDEDDFSVH